MGVSNVNAKQQIVQLALKKKGSVQVRKNPQLVYLSKNGSIFNAPGVKPANNPTNSRPDIRDLNTNESLKDLDEQKPDNNPAAQSDSEGEDPSSGDVTLSGVRSSTSDTKTLTTRVNTGAKTVKQLGTSGAKLQKEIKAGDKAYVATIKQQQAELDKENARLTKVIQQTEETQTLVANAQNELDSLTSGGTITASNRARAGELQTYIGAKVGLLQQNGRTIYSLQRVQSRVLTRMNRMNARYIRVQHTNTKAIENQQNKTNEVAETAAKAEQISAMTQTGGQALALLGEALIAAGSIGGGFGAGLVSVGMVMKKVGTVAEMVGQYGQAAAGLTKTAAYAADGELCAAMMSAASAVQSGMAAAKSTATIGKTFDAINEQGNAQIQNIAARSAAKDAVNTELDNYAKSKGLESAKDLTKQQQQEALGGLTKKQATKFTKNRLELEMAGGEIKTTKKWGNSQLKDYKAQMQETGKAELNNGTKGTYAQGALDYAKNTYTGIKEEIAYKNNLISEEQWNEHGKHELQKDGKYYKTIDGKEVKISKYNKAVNKAFKQRIKDLKPDRSATSNFGDTFSKFGASMTNIAAVFMQDEAIKGTTQKRQLEPFQMDARTRRIMQRNQRYRMHAAFV